MWVESPFWRLSLLVLFLCTYNSLHSIFSDPHYTALDAALVSMSFTDEAHMEHVT
ncbi:hypothetical protein M758_9G063000 [Ceratodon purpureus]|nr:hypothetical protein M758_9G063000 [Ceratodon purpureus]